MLQSVVVRLQPSASSALSASVCRRMASSTALPIITSYINGARVPVDAARAALCFDKRNPATGQVFAQVQSADERELNHAVAVAQAAQREWAALNGAERSRILRKAAQLIRDRTQALAEVEVRDVGKPIAEALSYDINSGADVFEYYASVAATMHGKFFSNFSTSVASRPARSFAYTIREPLGVCAGIGAWNYPFQIASWKTAPALACGNSMVFKPSELTPSSAVELAAILTEAGVPAGVFNVVQGAGNIGRGITAHPDIAKVTFTGESGTGKHVMRSSSDSLKKVTLELGGKSPLIVFDDCKLDDAVSGALMANFYTQGEVCTNGTRVFVQRSIHDKFIARLRERMSATAQPGIVIGNPMDEKTNVGALISEPHMQKVLGYIAKGKAEGAKLIAGGNRFQPTDAAFKDGYFVEPTVFDECSDSMAIVREEIFGPVMSILPFDTDEEVIRRANATSFGLAAGVFTSSLQRAHTSVASLQAGIVWVNNYNLAPVEVPFGGFKESGIGKENGTESIENFTQLKMVYMEMDGIASVF
ncbi:betaine aldehyde dehydrogenase [Capsaspora owczarzaki ATCC 30864]|uniref:Betaine aldehyde dehydrogenase n=1 Tax=Capsaspora owczarzaki (strain ATCC 30864) TaxID=595528 RepID=A0A0D2VGD4_CAPO3|nr:betaine aldehyde dehydrogenase [Capsaspora owczarzaki ATCC 30864]KJE88932.1 betaine aldehyde dehydrogenase [Capsaspora owczarzaki ATCC 30864]|eukprot:XP_004365371.1 betaine aldehyde dehydrogenase [Capsaspora owczarzaki ATCC 30864]